MTKIILALTLCTAVAAPAFAMTKTTKTVTTTTNNAVDPACVPTNSISGDTVYYTPAPTEAQAAPARTHRHMTTAQERRREWLRTHTPSGMILGNMSGAAGTSALAYMHGTDNPQGGHIFLDNDQGPSARDNRWNRSSAYDTSTDDNF